MKKVLLILLVLIVAGAGTIWFVYFRGGKKRPKGPEPIPLTVSKHSPAFNQSVQSVLDAYYKLSEGFVNWDTLVVSSSIAQLNTALDSLKVEELKIDSIIYQSALDPVSNAKAITASMMNEPSLDSKKNSFNQLSDNLRLLFVVVKYDANKLYWQECPMAFGDDRPGNWLSKTDEVRNPYLGTKHPVYKAAMLSCGGPKDTINFMQADTTKRL